MEYLRFVPVVLAGCLSYLFGEWTALLTILFTLVILDFISGILASAVDGELKSKIGWVGIARKVFIFVMVSVAHLVDKLLIESGFESMQVVMTMVIVFYSVNEVLSVTENAGRIGLPVPDQIKDAIDVLNKGSKKGR